MPTWIRMVLKNDTEGRSQLATHAARERWFIDRVVQHSDTAPFELVYISRKNNNTAVHYIEDEIMNLALVLVRGEQCVEVADGIREKVETVPREHVLKYIASAKDETGFVMAAYIAAATGTSEYDKELFGIIEQASVCAFPEGRRAALIAMGYLEWLEFAPIIENLCNDSDEAVRQSARSARKYWQKIGSIEAQT